MGSGCGGSCDSSGKPLPRGGIRVNLARPMWWRSSIIWLTANMWQPERRIKR